MLKGKKVVSALCIVLCLLALYGGAKYSMTNRKIALSQLCDMTGEDALNLLVENGLDIPGTESLEFYQDTTHQLLLLIEENDGKKTPIPYSYTECVELYDAIYKTLEDNGALSR